MKKVIKKIIIQSLITMLFYLNASAGFENTDVIMSDIENSIYMTGCRLTRITDAKKEPACSSTIYKIDLNNNINVVFYRDSNLYGVQVSPDSNRLAAIRNYFSQTPELIIIDKVEKKEISNLNAKIVKYVWSPDSSAILYITGEKRSKSRMIDSTGVWIYDIEREYNKKIAEKAQDVFWPKGDDIFVVDYEKKYDESYNISTIYDSYMYNIKTGVSTKKGVKGVKFSPDGRYSILYRPEFYNLPDDKGNMRIDFYNLQKENKISSEDVSSLFQNPKLVSWDSFFFGKGNRVIFWEMPWETLIRNIIIGDIENNKILKVVKGKYRILGVNFDRSKIVIYNEGKFQAIQVP